MMFPDQSHISHVRDALWQRPQGYASVMVGSGYSRNARPARPDSREFPLWKDIAQLLCTKLYPTSDGYRLNRAIAEASGTSGFLRLAQEYEAAFGRGDMHGFIRGSVPDDDYLPDDLHIRLLRLPWRDVFTTNWDTLLERTLPLVADRSYGVIHTIDEIPLGLRPRIVKLHGSFPAHVPFIFTEEDYRTYPRRYAPFVNTVQQAMMETTFILLGFSGDDPNFLHWSGWVRDNLGESMPKIYLAGWLDLSPHRRRMLEERNVVPIDLSRHPQATRWPDHLRHRYALEWVLHILEHGRPYDITKWPDPPDWKKAEIPDYLLPVEDVSTLSPVKEPKVPDKKAELAALQESVRNIIPVWKHNREVYPGWLLIPEGKNVNISRETRDWESVIVKVLPDTLPAERLLVISELVWRLEYLLEPLSERAEEVALAACHDIDCNARSICGLENQSVDWAELRKAWSEVALALLTAARLRFNRDSFDKIIALLKPHSNDSSDVAQRIHHENCLWELYNFNYEKLDKLLADWHPENCDPIWMTRKAAILAEADREEEAVQLIKNSLSIVRNTSPADRTLAGPSREGWTLWLALGFRWGFSQPKSKALEAPDAFERWRQLASLLCDAFAQKHDLRRTLQHDSEKKEGPLFDLGARRGERISFSNIQHERLINAYRAVRMSEVAGLPPSAFHCVVASDILADAAGRLAPTHLTLALRLALRLATSEDDFTFNCVWSRPRIAAMPIEEVVALVKCTSDAIVYILNRARSSETISVRWVTRLRITVEALSRLVLRLPPDQAEGIFKRGLTYYRNEVIAKHRWVSKAMNNLLARSWQSMPKDYQNRNLLDVLSAPLAELDGLVISDRNYPDPGELIGDEDKNILPPRVQENEQSYVYIVQLIIRGLHSNGDTRRRAALRLVPLAIQGRLTEPEKERVAQALWRSDIAKGNQLPQETNLLDWIFLLLPEVEAGKADKLFRIKWFSPQTTSKKVNPNDLFWHVGIGLSGLREHNKLLTLTKEDIASILASVQAWINDPVPSYNDPFMDSHYRSNINNGIYGLQYLLPEIDLMPSLAEQLLAKIDSLNQADVPGFQLLAGLAKYFPDRLEKIVQPMRMGLASNNSDVADKSMLGLMGWLVNASGKVPDVPAPPLDLVQEIGIIIASRRKEVLTRALQAARWIFEKGSSEQQAIIAQFTLHGLSFLIEELRYDREHGEEDIPLLRWLCAHLAIAMSASGYEDEQTVKRWLEVAREDPLPEVRYAEISCLVSNFEATPSNGKG